MGTVNDVKHSVKSGLEHAKEGIVHAAEKVEDVAAAALRSAKHALDTVAATASEATEIPVKHAGEAIKVSSR